MKRTWKIRNQPGYRRIFNPMDRLTNVPMVVSNNVQLK